MEVIASARGEVALSRTFAAPRLWICDAAQRKQLATARGRRALRTWSDGQARRAFADPRLRALIPSQAEAEWRELRWLYVGKKLCDPEAFLQHGALRMPFFSQELQTHPALLPHLRRAERAWSAQSSEPPFAWGGSLSPRTVRGPFKRQPRRLSNHALGMAVDLDPAYNPYLSREELALITRLTGVALARGDERPAGARWDDFQRANLLFMILAPQALAQLSAQLEREARPARRKKLQARVEALTSKNLSRAMRQGFLSLPRGFVVAMEDAGLTWATDFSAGADLMHFELRDPSVFSLTKP